MWVFLELVATVMVAVLSLWYFLSKRASLWLIKGVITAAIIMVALRLLVVTVIAPTLALVAGAFKITIVVGLVLAALGIMAKFFFRVSAR